VLLAVLYLVAGAVTLLVWVPELSALGWAAIAAGLTAAIAGTVQGLVTSGIGKGRDLILGGASPVAVQVVFTHQKLSREGRDGTGGPAGVGVTSSPPSGSCPSLAVRVRDCRCSSVAWSSRSRRVRSPVSVPRASFLTNTAQAGSVLSAQMTAAFQTMVWKAVIQRVPGSMGKPGVSVSDEAIDSHFGE
jgi:hypothetical protein